jgi:hypothetical protein
MLDEIPLAFEILRKENKIDSFDDLFEDYDRNESKSVDIYFEKIEFFLKPKYAKETFYAKMGEENENEIITEETEERLENSNLCDTIYW